jgi:hypothetical protein
MESEANQGPWANEHSSQTELIRSAAKYIKNSDTYKMILVHQPDRATEGNKYEYPGCAAPRGAPRPRVVGRGRGRPRGSRGRSAATRGSPRGVGRGRGRPRGSRGRSGAPRGSHQDHQG